MFPEDFLQGVTMTSVKALCDTSPNTRVEIQIYLLHNTNLLWQ